MSASRILTTHVGSLPRNDKLTDLLVRQQAGDKISPDWLDLWLMAAYYVSLTFGVVSLMVTAVLIEGALGPLAPSSARMRATAASARRGGQGAVDSAAAALPAS